MSSPISTSALRQRAPRLAEVAVERARLTVVPRGSTRASRVPFFSLVTVLLLGGVVGLLLFNTSMQQSSFTATTLEQRATLLSARQESLAMQLEQLRNPQVIGRRAQQLGMRVPAAPLFLDLADGSVEGDPAGAQALAPVLLDPRPPARPAELDPSEAVVRPPEGELAGQTGDRTRDQARDQARDQGRGAGRSEDRAERRGDRAERGTGARNARGDGRRDQSGDQSGDQSRDQARDQKKNKQDQKDKKKNRDR